MTINNYAKKWCEEDYDIKKEDFYVDNAYYIVKRQWARGALKHAIVPFIIFAVSFLINISAMGPVKAIFESLANGGIFVLAFWFYGIRNYDANDEWSAKGIYIILLLFLFLTKPKLPFVLISIFGIVLFALYIYLTVLNPIDYIKSAKTVKKRIIEEEKEEEDKSKQSYENWKNKYQAYRFGIPESSTIPDEDPLLEKARSLFDGYCDNQQVLKTRFRQLIKQYHPDAGGDTEFCQRIIQVYEEYQKNFAA